MTKVVIQKATEQNIISVADLTREFFPYMNMNADKVYERMKKGVNYVVAKEEGKTIGFADYEIIEKPAETHQGVENKKTAKILGVCVDAEHQSKGIGKKLLERVLTEVEGKVEQIVLLVEKENARAIRLYEKYGFHVQGKLERQMWGKEIVLMVKNT